MNDPDPAVVAEVRRQLLQLLPEELVADRLAAVAESIARKLAFEPDRADLDLPHFVDLVVAGFDLAGWYEFDRINPETVNAKCREFARELVHAVAGLYGGRSCGDALPPNAFLATRYHDTIRIPSLTGVQLGPPEALALGCWLIALSDPTLKAAVPMLLSVATR